MADPSAAKERGSRLLAALQAAAATAGDAGQAASISRRSRIMYTNVLCDHISKKILTIPLNTRNVQATKFNFNFRKL